MRTLRQQILVLLLTALILLASSFIFIFSWHMKERAVAAAIIKAKSDLATCAEIVDLKYPGEWQVMNNLLFKGEVKINENNQVVDRLAELTGDTVTFFLGDTRIATNVRDEAGRRALGTKVSEVVAQKVLHNGEINFGEASVLGNTYQTAYRPVKDKDGKIIGILYVGISRSYAQQMINNSLKQTAILGIVLTALVGMLTWFLADKNWIRPLKNIALGTRDLATGHVTEKVDVSGPQEIGDLASAFNQMIERLEDVAKSFEEHTPNPEAEENDQFSQPHKNLVSLNENMNDNYESNYVNDYVNNNVNKNLKAKEEDLKRICLENLPKGLNKKTLEQIYGVVTDLGTPASAEQIAEGVKLTRVTVRRYLEFLEQCGVLESDLKYGAVGRPLRQWFYKKEC